ncbi:MAG: hypothetical protein ABW001_07495 [Mycobacterium sp.]
MDELLRSPSGGIRVRTTERGLPVALKLDERELRRPAKELANDILLLCQLSAKRQQVSRRRDLAARGFSAAVIHGLNLCTADDLNRAERRVDGYDEEAEPDTWLGPV